MQTESHPALQASRSQGHARRHPRVLLSVPITVRRLVRGGIRTCRGISLDLSESGVGLLVEGSVPVGDTLEIQLQLPGWEFSTVAIVRHSSSVRSGCEFLGLTVEERGFLARIVGRA